MLHVFIAQGRGADIRMGEKKVIVIGADPEYEWRTKLYYASGVELSLHTINNEQWVHPPVGLLRQGHEIRFEAYFDPIKKHLVEKMEYSPQQAESALRILKSKGLATGDYTKGVLRFGAPVGIELGE